MTQHYLLVFGSQRPPENDSECPSWADLAAGREDFSGSRLLAQVPSLARDPDHRPKARRHCCNLLRRFQRLVSGEDGADVRRDPDTEELIALASQGDRQARELLLARHRERLTQMVRVRMDRRLAGCEDPSEVVQEALAEAAQKLSGHLRERPVPFYPWLRELAVERLVTLNRRHVQAGRSLVINVASG